MTDLLARLPRILGPNDGELLGAKESPQDRFLVSGSETGGRLAIVEHRLPPHALAAPMHFHTLEDEFSWVIEGEVGVSLGGQVLVAQPGQLVIKPRGEWHTFWNAGATPARILELITPGGLERLFKAMGIADEMDPDELSRFAGEFGCEADFEATERLVQAHGLKF